MTTTGAGSHWSVYNYDRDGTPISKLNVLSYSSYTHDTSDRFDPGLQLVIDPGNTSGLDAGVAFSTLNFRTLPTAALRSSRPQHVAELERDERSRMGLPSDRRSDLRSDHLENLPPPT